jgi:tetratricopeptide (TPR) repeat protein
MMKRLLPIVLVILGLTVPGRADIIYSLIAKGDLDEARDSLSSASTALLRDGNRLFYLSLLEPNADKSAQLMEAALNASVAAAYREEIYFRLAQYYFLRGDLKKLEQTVIDYRALWEAGKYWGEMFRISVLVDEMVQAYESAVRQADRYLLEYSEGHPAQWGIIDKARVMQGYNKPIGAHKLLRKLSQEKSGPGVPQALYMLTIDAVANKRTDDAVFYYNILRESYPNTVGLDALVEKMSDLSAPDTDDATAEKLTGTFYSVQVGVFSEEENAKRQANVFSNYDQEVDVKTKTISNKKYRVVYVGRFQTYDAALQFKKMLEASHNEVFQVVAR